MTHHTDTRRPSRHLFYASPGRFSSTLLLSTFFLGACDATSRPGDTLGLQTSARWEWHARLVVERDPTLTLVRLRIDTTQGGGGVGGPRHHLHPPPAQGGEDEPAGPPPPPPLRGAVRRGTRGRESTRLNF